MKKLIILTVIILISCNKIEVDKIVLTTGINMKPSEPRFGIEISKDSLYYCEEIITNKGTYNFYKTKINSGILETLKNKIKNNFVNDIKSRPIYDATAYQLDTNFDGKSKKIKFYYSFLNDNQVKIINEIIELKKLDLEKMEYYSFPKELLTEELPEPPPPVKIK